MQPTFIHGPPQVPSAKVYIFIEAPLYCLQILLRNSSEGILVLVVCILLSLSLSSLT